jgi:hypothetical protein
MHEGEYFYKVASGHGLARSSQALRAGYAADHWEISNQGYFAVLPQQPNMVCR